MELNFPYYLPWAIPYRKTWDDSSRAGLKIGIPPDRFCELGIALAVADEALGQIVPPSEVGEPSGARHNVDGGGHGSQQKTQVH